MTEPEFVGEAVQVAEGDFAVSGRPGEPALPKRFSWRGREYEVAEVLETRKETGGCRHGSGERYVRKHWYRIRTTDGEEMELFFERQPRSGREAKMRWWLHTRDHGPLTTDHG